MERETICHGVAVFLMVYSDQPADPVAQERSTVSDHTGSDTDEFTSVKYIINCCFKI